jgi:serine/threonine protein kinase
VTEPERPRAPSSPCPSEDALLAYVRGGGRDKGSERLLGHIDHCRICRQVVAEAARSLDPNADAGRPAAGGAHTLAVGERVVGRYDIRRFIARGGMGEVYEAYDMLLDEPVALKTLACTALDDARAAFRFRGEARLARRVTHPNVARILEFGLHVRDRNNAQESMPFLTMEFLSGETLARRIRRRGRYETGDARSLVKQILAGLKAIHDAGIVHRDLKSENVFLVPDARGGERAVVMDFGLARAIDGSVVTTWPRSSVFAGTLDCMAPEQIEGRKVGPPADVFAMGVLLFELCTGRRPFVNVPPLKRLQADEPPSPSAFVDELDPRWDEVITRCLARNPADRFDLEELTAALSPPPPRRSRWTALWVIAAGLAVGVACLALLRLLTNNG